MLSGITENTNLKESFGRSTFFGRARCDDYFFGVEGDELFGGLETEAGVGAGYENCSPLEGFGGIRLSRVSETAAMFLG